MRIGVFDSGVGGITVLRELLTAFPGSDFTYLGDTANVPYGTKSPRQVERLCAKSASRLRDRGIDALVVACNTASSLALSAIREAMGGVPVLGVVEPGARAAVAARAESPGGGPIVVFATRATVRSGAYGRALAVLAPRAEVREQECPLLVPIIEEGWIHHPLLELAVREYVEPFAAARSPGVALLACTHYPWIQDAFEKALPGWKVVDSAQAVARALRAISEATGTPDANAGTGAIDWIFTDPEAVPEFARAWIRERKPIGNGQQERRVPDGFRAGGSHL